MDPVKSDPNTPRPSISKSSLKDQNLISFKDPTVDNAPQITKKKSTEELRPESTPASRDGAANSSGNDKVKSEKTKRPPTRRDTTANEAQEQRMQASPEAKSSKSKNSLISKVSSDTVVVKEKNSEGSGRDGFSGQNAESLINFKIGVVASSDSKIFRKESFRKSPKSSESPSRQSIPPISSQDTPKNSSPELNTTGSSTSSSPLHHSHKPTASSNPSSIYKLVISCACLLSASDL